MSSNNPDTSSTIELAQQRTDLASDRTRWAADRTFWASDRTLLAWNRTAISMIGFGVGFGKTADYLESSGTRLDEIQSLTIMGTVLIALACLGLFGAVSQSVRIDKRLAKTGYARVEPLPLAVLMSILVLVIGIFGMVAIHV